MTPTNDTRETIPRYCRTDGCHREPTLLVYLGLGESGIEDEQWWICSPCHEAMINGNQTPGGNIQVIEDVA